MGGWLPRFVDIFLWRFFGSSIHVSSLLMDGFPEEANRATRIEEIAIVEFPAQFNIFQKFKLKGNSKISELPK
jgi:hypothetical protein